MNIEDINKECKKLSEKQSYIKKTLEDFFKNVNKELDTNNADISLHIGLSAWEQSPNYPYDFDGEFDNQYYLTLEDGEFKLQLDDTEYYNQTGTIDYEDVLFGDITAPKTRNILIALPDAFKTILQKLQNLNTNYENAEKIAEKIGN
jgi:hypothetical protein